MPKDDFYPRSSLKTKMSCWCLERTDLIYVVTPSIPSGSYSEITYRDSQSRYLSRNMADAVYYLHHKTY